VENLAANKKQHHERVSPEMAPAAQHRLALCRSSRCSVAAAKQEQDTSQYDNRCTD